MSSIESRGEASHSFGQVVRALRRELGLTQDELAHRVGCAPITLRKIEHDDLRPSMQIAERLALALNLLLEERAAFVRLARSERPPELITPTPAPKPEEIGAEDLTGRAIRGYALAERIGAGGMGAVYRAVQPLVEREVAIKIILPQYANQPDFIRRFEVEAQIVARLEHPHIVPLYDYWREPNVAFLVMRLLRGGSLRGLLEKGPLPLDVVTRLLEQIGSALGTAHRAGVVHRDLKPANVMLDEDTNAYLADFGIAKNLSNLNFEGQTQADVIVGSPAYISPEQIRSEFVRPQTDIYALGVMLYELLTGTIPFSGPTPVEIMHQHLSAPLPPLAAHRTGLPKAWDNIIGHATAKDPLERYPDVEGLLADVRSVVSNQPSAIGLAAVRPTVASRPLTAEDNPYKGLRAFGESDTADFFGREALTTQLLMRMSEGGDLSRFLAIIGPSGSGKSSIVGAGLVPALRQGALPGSDNWFIVQMLPGPRPLEELEAALLRIAVNPPESLLSQLREDKRGLLRAVRRCLPDDPNVELVLVVDQFEEVFTLVPAEDEAVRAHVLDSLTTAVLDERSRLRVIITLRADFTDRPLSYVDFGELLRQRSEFVLPLTPDELEQAIVRPAERVGLQLETGLVPAIMRDVGDQPGALPLLQYALTELFEQREDHTLTRAAYQSIGGVLGALGRRAEEVYSGLSNAERAMARQMFLRLVTLGEGVEDTRRRVLRAELESLAEMAPTLTLPRDEKRVTREGSSAPSLVGAVPTGEGRGGGSVSPVMDVFGKHRLLTFDRDPITRGPTVEVAHEALLREWARLREWLSESRADVRLQRLLADEATQWNAAQRDTSYLLIGAHLEQFEGWALSTSVALTQDERAYLDASIAERDRQRTAEAERQRRELEAARQLAETERARADSEQHRAEEQTRSANRLHTRNRVIAAAGVMALLLAALAGLFGLQSNQNATRADQNAAQAQTNLIAAQANAATAQAASGLADQQRVAAVNAQANAQRNAAEAQNVALVSGSQAALANGNTDQANALALQAVTLNPLSARAQAALSEAAYAPGTVRRFTGHMDDVYQAALSPDGHTALSASADKTLILWDIQTGAILRRFEGHTDAVRSVNFSPDGLTAISASDDMTLILWDIQTGKIIRRFAGHKDKVRAVALSQDGRFALSGGDDKTLILWDVQTGEIIRHFQGHTDTVTSVAFSPDGRTALSGSRDKTLILWDLQTGQIIRRFGGDIDPVWSVAFSPDGRSAFSGGTADAKSLDK